MPRENNGRLTEIGTRIIPIPNTSDIELMRKLGFKLTDSDNRHFMNVEIPQDWSYESYPNSFSSWYLDELKRRRVFINYDKSINQVDGRGVTRILTRFGKKYGYCNQFGHLVSYAASNFQMDYITDQGSIVHIEQIEHRRTIHDEFKPVVINKSWQEWMEEHHPNYNNRIGEWESPFFSDYVDN